jgi:hypothetical protein
MYSKFSFSFQFQHDEIRCSRLSHRPVVHRSPQHAYHIEILAGQAKKTKRDRGESHLSRRQLYGEDGDSYLVCLFAMSRAACLVDQPWLRSHPHCAKRATASRRTQKCVKCNVPRRASTGQARQILHPPPIHRHHHWSKSKPLRRECFACLHGVAMNFDCELDAWR